MVMGKCNVPLCAALVLYISSALKNKFVNIKINKLIRSINGDGGEERQGLPLGYRVWQVRVSAERY